MFQVSPDSGGANTGFRCASGSALNVDGREIAIEGLEADGEGMSQEKLQKVAGAPITRLVCLPHFLLLLLLQLVVVVAAACHVAAVVAL